MTLALWISLLGASIIISFTPGAGAINTMTNAMRLGFRGAIWGIIGQQIALLIHVIIVAAGVGILVASSPAIFAAVRYAGAAYLVYLGVRMILSKPDVSSESTTQTRVSGRWAMVRRGILVNLLNPKAIVFFLAFIPPFIRADLPAAPQYLIIAATCVVVDVLVMWFGFAMLARPLGRLMHTTRGQRILNAIFGVCFILVAGLLFLVH